MKMVIIPPPKYLEFTIDDPNHIPRVGEFVSCFREDYPLSTPLRVAKIEYTMFGSDSDMVELYLEEQ
jgi:hypothetical protein